MFQDQELTDELDLNVYGFKWRTHDPAIGRFWQIDPLADTYVYNSTYAFSENKVVAHRELEGLEAEWATGWALGQETYRREKIEGSEAAKKYETARAKGMAAAGIGGASLAIPGPEDVAVAVFAASKFGKPIIKAVSEFSDEVSSSIKGLFGKGDEAVKSFGDLADIGKIDPSEVKFSQGSISAKFKDGGSVKDLTKGLKDGSINPDNISAIRIVEKDGKIFTLDNRRLKAFQDAGVDINYQKLDAIPKNEQFKFKDYNSGKN